MCFFIAWVAGDGSLQGREGNFEGEDMGEEKEMRPPFLFACPPSVLRTLKKIDQEK